MTIKPSGPLAVSEVNTEIGVGATYSSGLRFLNDKVKPAQKTEPPRMSVFYNMSYFQNTTEGNCNNGGEANCPGACGNAGNCSNCGNCIAVNCVNCDPQPYLQVGANCACTYNCDVSEVYPVNCNCQCNCSKVVCRSYHALGNIPDKIWAADELYGMHLFKRDRPAYRGYIRWGRIVSAWMEKDPKAPTYLFWIKDKEKRAQAQQDAILKMAANIVTPWSEHMAFLMGTLPEDNYRGRVLMNIGAPICRFMDKVPRITNPKYRHLLPSLYLIWAILYICHWTASAAVMIQKIKSKLFKKGASNAIKI
jgi:hypothetical protein